jgi:hypothetical protein
MDGEMYVEDSLGKVIREFFRELFGSRLVALLEMDLLRLRQDMDARLQDKDRVIATLREDIQRLNSKVTTYELSIMPHASRLGAEVVKQVHPPIKPTFAFEDLGPAKSKWQAVQEAHDAQMRKELAEEEAAKEKAAATA